MFFRLSMLQAQNKGTWTLNLPWMLRPNGATERERGLRSENEDPSVENGDLNPVLTIGVLLGEIDGPGR